jgi:hypothetical protein
VFLKNQGIPVSERQCRAYRPVHTVTDELHREKKLAVGWVDRHCVTELPRATLGKQGKKTGVFVNR